MSKDLADHAVHALDRLRELGCNISITSLGGWFVQITLMHVDGECGHTARVKGPTFAPTVHQAILQLLEATEGSKCTVDVGALKLIAAGL